MDLAEIETYLTHSPTMRLLRADQGAYVLHFLQRTFRGPQADPAAAISQEDLKQALVDFQDELRAAEIEALAGPPDRYLLDWSDHGYLQRWLSADRARPQYQLTRFTEDAIRFVDAAISRGSRLIGTESRLRLVIDTLNDLARGASADPQRRLQQLKADRQQIDDEIAAIEAGGKVSTYHPAQLRERFQTAIELLKSLQGDFRAVEDRFVEIAKQVQRDSSVTGSILAVPSQGKVAPAELTRGQILANALDAEDLLKEQDEGISFYAFVSFLFSPRAQAELRETINEIVRLEAISSDRRSIEYIRQMVPSLLAEADNVLQRTGQLSQVLRRLLDAESAEHRQRTAAVLRDIRVLAGRLKPLLMTDDRDNWPKIGLSVEHLPGFSSPVSRPFWAPPQRFQDAPKEAVVDLRQAEQFALRLAAMQRLELGQMRDLIREITQQQRSIRLSELVQRRKPTAGVIELVGWLQIAHDDGHVIDPAGSETIELELPHGQVQVLVPLVTYFQTDAEASRSLRQKRPR